MNYITVDTFLEQSDASLKSRLNKIHTLEKAYAVFDRLEVEDLSVYDYEMIWKPRLSKLAEVQAEMEVHFGELKSMLESIVEPKLRQKMEEVYTEAFERACYFKDTGRLDTHQLFHTILKLTSQFKAAIK